VSASKGEQLHIGHRADEAVGHFDEPVKCDHARGFISRDERDDRNGDGREPRRILEPKQIATSHRNEHPRSVPQPTRLPITVPKKRSTLAFRVAWISGKSTTTAAIGAQ
jgi:hypothetical protein